MTLQMYICLAIFAFMILGYTFADRFKTTTGIIALCTIMITALCGSFFGLVDPKAVLGNFGNANALLIVGMFIVAAGFNRTQAVRKMSGLVYKISGGSFIKMLSGYILLTFLLAQFIPSPLAVYAIICPLAATMCEECGVSPSKAMFPLCIVDVGTCMCLPIGSGATTFATNNGYLESYGYTDFSMGLLDNFVGRAPIAVIIILFAIFVAPKLAPDHGVLAAAASVKNRKSNGQPEQPPLDSVREVLGYVIFVATTLALIFQGKLGLASWQIAMTGAMLVMVTGVLKPKEGIAAIPVRIVLLLVAALSVGGAMVACGLGDLIGDTLAAALGGTTNGYVIGAVFFIVPFILTQFMQNQSVSNIFMPILILTCRSLGCNPVGPLILLGSACLTAFLTPMATPVVPVVMEAGGYDMKDLFKQGWLPSIIICVVSIFWVMTMFPAF